MSLQDQEGLILLDQQGLALLDQLRSPRLEVMSQVQKLLITATPAADSRSSWTTSLNGVTTIQIRAADWGACTALDFVFSPVEGTTGEFEPPEGAEYPIFKSVAFDDVEMVFNVDPSYKNYFLAVIPRDNDALTDIQVLFS